jgi:hypothetical protein
MLTAFAAQMVETPRTDNLSPHLVRLFPTIRCCLSTNIVLLYSLSSQYLLRNTLSTYRNFLRWTDIIDRCGIDRELVSLAYHFFDRFINEQVDIREYTRNQVHCIALSVLLVAIKAKLSTEEAAIATEIARGECERSGLNPEDLAAVEREMLVVLDWRTNAPTMCEFARWYTLLHPLTVAGDDFNANSLLDIARSLMERAVASPEIMTNFMASEIAFAAMQRAGELLGDDVVTEEMLDEFDVLMEELEISDTNVLHALFCLENFEGAPPAAAVNWPTALVARIQVDDDGDTSPVSVAVN